jgi:tungstate transport system substrate-binding protein
MLKPALAAGRLAAALFLMALAGCAPAAPAVAPTTAKPAAPAPAPLASPPTAPAPPAVPSPVASPSPSPSPAAAAPAPTAVPRSGSDRDLILATTTSTQDTGLLDVLVPMFEKLNGYQVKTVSVGTGAALALGARGEADVVLVHAPDSEKQWMAQGNGTARLLVMHNDFVIVGPDDDPAKVRGTPQAADALKKIFDLKASFVSRGDNSGTNQAELQLWKRAGLEPKGQPWYVESGTGMGQTLTIADQKRAYTLTDRGTWLARKAQLALFILVEGDPALFNVYHVMPVNPDKFPNVKINLVGGKAFAEFLVAPQTQKLIADFGKDKFGQALFIPDAGKRDEEVGG